MLVIVDGERWADFVENEVVEDDDDEESCGFASSCREGEVGRTESGEMLGGGCWSETESSKKGKQAKRGVTVNCTASLRDLVKEMSTRKSSSAGDKSR